MCRAVHVFNLEAPEDVKNQEHEIYKGREKNSHKKKKKQRGDITELYMYTTKCRKWLKVMGRDPVNTN